MARDLYRIAVIGPAHGNRRYISGTADKIKFAGRAEALHWNKTEATILCDGLNFGLAQQKLAERLQIEKA